MAVKFNRRPTRVRRGWTAVMNSVRPEDFGISFEVADAIGQMPSNDSELRVLLNKSMRCWFCGSLVLKGVPSQHIRLRTWDHLMPLSRGGDNSLLNKVCACRLCNNQKAARTLEEYRTALKCGRFWGEEQANALGLYAVLA